MKRMIRLLAGCLLSLCLLLPGVTALAAPDDTGEVIDPSLPAAAGRAGTPEEETGSPSGTEVGDPGDFTLGEDGRLQASTAFFLTIEKAPSGGGSSGGGSGDSGGILRPLIPLDVKIIEEIPIPVSPIPDTRRRARPPRSARGGNRIRNHAFPCRFRFLRKAGPVFSAHGRRAEWDGQGARIFR